MPEGRRRCGLTVLTVKPKPLEHPREKIKYSAEKKKYSVSFRYPLPRMSTGTAWERRHRGREMMVFVSHLLPFMFHLLQHVCCCYLHACAIVMSSEQNREQIRAPQKVFKNISFQKINSRSIIINEESSNEGNSCFSCQITARQQGPEPPPPTEMGARGPSGTNQPSHTPQSKFHAAAVQPQHHRPPLRVHRGGVEGGDQLCEVLHRQPDQRVYQGLRGLLL